MSPGVMTRPVCFLSWPANVPGQLDCGWTEPDYVENFQSLKIKNAMLEHLRYMLECQLQGLQQQLCRADMEKGRLQEENATQRRDRALQNAKMLVQKDCLQKLEKQLQDERLQAERLRLEREETQRSIALRAAESEKEVQRLQQEKADHEERLAGMQKQLEGLRKEKEKEIEEAEKQRTEAEEHSGGLAQKVAESEKEVQRLQQEKADSEQRLATLQKHVETPKQDKLEQQNNQKKIEEALSSLISLRTLLEEAHHKDLQRSSQSLFALEQRLKDAQDYIKLLLEAPFGREEELQPEATPVDFCPPKAGDQEPPKNRPSLGARSHDSQGSTTSPEGERDNRTDSFDIDVLEEQLQHGEASSGHEEDLQPQAERLHLEIDETERSLAENVAESATEVQRSAQEKADYKDRCPKTRPPLYFTVLIRGRHMSRQTCRRPREMRRRSSSPYFDIELDWEIANAKDASDCLSTEAAHSRGGCL